MQRFLEIILGLDKGFLSREGEFALEFNPHWPWQDQLGAVTWNILLSAGALALIFYVYQRDGRSRTAKILLGSLRGLLAAFVILLLNRPVLILGQTRQEPSVLAVLVDDSISMSKVRDVPQSGTSNQPISRLDAAIQLLSADDQALLRKLASVHQVRLYHFSTDAATLGPAVGTGIPLKTPDPAAAAKVNVPPALLTALKSLDAKEPAPSQNRTQVVQSLLSVLGELQGQRLAGLVLLTDGRDTPVPVSADALKRLKDFGVPVFPVALGSEEAPKNIEIQSVSVQDNVFVDDLVNYKLTLRATGYPKGHQIKVALKDKSGDVPLKDAQGRPVMVTVVVNDDNPIEQEIVFKPDRVGPLTVVAQAEKEPGELEETDNVRESPISVLDAHIAVLYVDGYPRWEYRYLKNEMIRDKTVDISCLLTSADPTFPQEGDDVSDSRHFPGRIKRFAESIEELMNYDVVLFGDVDPRQFTDRQLQLVSEFVSKKGGGFGMIAGPRWSPVKFRNTVIEQLLPVDLANAERFALPDGPLTEGFRPVLTKVGAASSVFRFFPDRAVNEKFVRDDLQPIFWYAQGISAKPGVGEVFAEHPVDSEPDGRAKAPLLVMGRYGAGRTLFSAIDDSWRWRFYTGEQVFDTYWIQQLRYLARGKKLGERRLNFTLDRQSYVLGEPVRIGLEVLDGVLLQQLPSEISVEVKDRATGQTTHYEKLQKIEGQPDQYAATFTADRVGGFVATLPPLASAAGLELPMDVSVPRLEMAQPEANVTLLRQIAANDPSTRQPALLTLASAAEALPRLLPSAAKTLWIPTNAPLWDAPLAMLIFVLLITTEWIVRKAYGML